MKNCPHCNKQIKDDLLTCNFCKKPLNEDSIFGDLPEMEGDLSNLFEASTSDTLEIPGVPAKEKKSQNTSSTTPLDLDFGTDTQDFNTFNFDNTENNEPNQNKKNEVNPFDDLSLDQMDSGDNLANQLESSDFQSDLLTFHESTIDEDSNKKGSTGTDSEELKFDLPALDDFGSADLNFENSQDASVIQPPSPPPLESPSFDTDKISKPKNKEPVKIPEKPEEKISIGKSQESGSGSLEDLFEDVLSESVDDSSHSAEQQNGEEILAITDGPSEIDILKEQASIQTKQKKSKTKKSTKKISKIKLLVTIGIFFMLFQGLGLFIYYKLTISNEGFYGWVYRNNQFIEVNTLKKMELREKNNQLVEKFSKEIPVWTFKKLEEKANLFQLAQEEDSENLNIVGFLSEIYCLMYYKSPVEHLNLKNKVIANLERLKKGGVKEKETILKIQGYLDFFEKKYKEASGNFQQYLTQNNKEVYPIYFSGICELEMQNPEKAKKLFTFLEKQPIGKHLGLTGLAFYFSKANDLNLALHYFVEAIKEKPDEIEHPLNIGEVFYQNKKYNIAIQYLILAPVAEYAKNSSKFQIGRAYYLMSLINKDILKTDKYHENLMKAMETDKFNPEYPFTLAKSLYANDNFTDALKYFTEAQNRNPNELKYKIGVGIGYNSVNKMVEAETLFKELLTKYPENADVNYELGNTYLLMEDGDLSPPFLEKAIKIDPNYSMAYLRLGDYYFLYKKDSEKTLQNYKKALELNAENHKINLALGRYYLVYGKNNEVLELAKNHLKKALELKPNSESAYNYMGEYYSKINNEELAFRNYNAALKINPGFIDTIINLGLLYKNSNNIDKAKGYFEKAIELDKSNPDAFSYLAEVLLVNSDDKNDWEKANSLLSQALEIDPNFDLAHFLKGLYLEQTGKQLEATVSYNYAAKLNPSNVRYQLALSKLFFNLNDYPAALQNLNAISKIDPNNTEVMHHKGIIYLRQNMLDKAIESFKNVLQVDRYNIEEYIWVGNTYKRMGMDKAAYQYLTTGIDLLKKKYKSLENVEESKKSLYCQACLEVGMLLANQRNRTALNWYKISMEICPNWGLPHKHLGMFWKENNNPNRAIEEFRKYMTYNPPDATTIEEEIFYLKRGY